MHKFIILGVLAAMAPLAAASDTDRQRLDKVLSTPTRLDAKEAAAVALAKRWQSNQSVAAQAREGRDGAVQFLHGAGQPTLVCAVMQVCDVQLQAGERVTSMHLGDSVRWLVEPAMSGNAQGQVSQHLIIKPLDASLDTTMLVTTDRRTYHMRLRSTRSEYLPKVSFLYADEVEARWAAMAQVQERARQQQTLPGTDQRVDELDFNYRMSGRAPWKPVRIYNDGTRTFVEMPDEMQQSEAPALFVVRATPGLLGKDEQVMVNYRVQGKRYIVDSVFDKAILIAGVGRSQTSVTLKREK